MMNIFSKLLILLVIVAMLAGCFASCGNDDVDNNPDVESGESSDNGGENSGDSGEEDSHQHTFVDGKCGCGENDPNYVPPVTEPEFIDYVSQVKFNPDSGRAWAYAEVVSYIDGDTTHFTTTDGTKIGDGSYVKARYLAINTPESTGVIEPWGKKAANYTKGQLMQATSIIIESDTDKWDVDSTGSRYLLWIWYKTSEDTEYRNLNLEILQQGLAFGSSVGSNVYGEIGLKIFNQANTLKLHVFNKAVKDPDYYYGEAIEVTLKELKASTYKSEDGSRYYNKYEGLLVKFEAIVAKQADTTIYVEEYDAENDMYFGMQLYAGYSYPRMSDFTIGNRVSIVGTLQYYENGGTYQISNLQCKILNPNWEGGCRVLSTGHSASYRELNVGTLLDGTIELDTIREIENENGELVETLIKETFDYGQLAHYSTAVLKNLKIQSVYTTESETDSDGALTISCKDENGRVIKIRTAQKLIKTVDGVPTVVTAADFPVGSIISVRGVVDSFKGEYQIKVFNINDITFE